MLVPQAIPVKNLAPLFKCLMKAGLNKDVGL